MSDFHDRHWVARYQTMGSTAENAFLELHPEAHRLGIDRPQFAVARLATFFRQAPDFLLADGAYEVMGVSSRNKNATLKLKFEKLETLKLWDSFGPTYLWVWDSYRKKFTCARIRLWAQYVEKEATIERFNDNNKPYWNLPITHFETISEQNNVGT